MDGLLNKKIKALSIDGGGIRGLYTAILIAEIEKNLKIKFSDYFDVFVGVSTGSILSALLFFGFSGIEIYEIYLKNYKTIFTKNKNGTVAKYDINVLNKVISNILLLNMHKIKVNKNKKLYISSFNLSENRPEIFEVNHLTKGLNIVNAITASCAAPYYFEPFKFNLSTYIDGGVVTNNPSLVAFSKIFNKCENLSDMKILSLGTIEKNKIFKMDYKKNFNFLEIFNIVISSSSTYIDEQLKEIFKYENNNYLRLNDETANEIYLDKISESLEEKIINVDKFFLKNKEKIQKFFER